MSSSSNPADLFHSRETLSRFVPQAEATHELTSQARRELLAVFGPTRFDDGQEARAGLSKTTLPRSTTPLGVVFPESRDEVAALMRLVSRYRIPWHAISRGKNWGYGDACAAADGHIIVDLQRMNRILEINESLGYAVIEPGVTQGELADQLKDRESQSMLDVTGAGPDASIVGNTLQRGFGHTPYGDHFANSCNYEFVLPDGKIAHTGFGHVNQSDVGHVYPYGSGPCLQGALSQSHNAIVTRMTVWLMPRPEAIQGFLFKSNDTSEFMQIVDRIGHLRRNGTIDSVVHLANDIRVLSTQPWMKEKSERRPPLSDEERREMAKRAGIAKWNGLGGLYGSRRIVSAKKSTLRKTFRGICRMRFFSQGHVRLLRASAPYMPPLAAFERLRNLTSAVSDVYDLLCGWPSPNHLEGAFFRNRPASGEVIDAGLIWIAPVIPFTGSDAHRLISQIEPIANEYGFDLPITISPVFGRSAICVMNISFDKSDSEECQRARKAYLNIKSTAESLGYPSYRSSSIDLAEPSA